MDRVEFVIPGKPMTWARARASGKGGSVRFFTPDDRRDRMDLIQSVWYGLNIPPFPKSADLVLQCRFVFPRPSSHYGSGKNADLLKESSRRLRPHGGTYGGDLDNLYKLIKDALNLVAFHDDAQVVEYGPDHGKFFCAPGEMPRTEIAIWVAETEIAPAYPMDAQGVLVAA